jgi:hypothetical protein
MVLALLLAVSLAKVLTYVSFQDAVTGSNLPANYVGLSLSFPRIYNSALTSSVFKGYIKNSWVYASTTASWAVSVKMQWPVGYKYKCPAMWAALEPNATCTLDVSPYYTTIGQFFLAVSNSGNGLSLGFDRQGLDLTNPDLSSFFFDHLMAYFSNIGFVNGNLPQFEVFDQADSYNLNNLTPLNYTPTSFLNELPAMSSLSPSDLMGPGITESAGK